MYESAGSQFYRTVTGIQSGTDTIKVPYELLAILGVTEILCSFRLVLEGKAGTEIPEPSRLELLEKSLAKNFAL